MKSFESVDDYIAQASREHRTTLKEVRGIVLETASHTVESIAYGMPAYTWNDKPLFYFAAMKGHLGLYPTPGPIRACKDIVKNFSTSKGCVRVPYNAKVPKKIIIALLKARMREIRIKDL